MKEKSADKTTKNRWQHDRTAENKMDRKTPKENKKELKDGINKEIMKHTQIK
jgi:hypothetical protein